MTITEADVARIAADVYRAATLAAAPPATIGELTNVPAPGSAILSAWAQDVTRRIEHRFATIAARNAAFPAPQAGTLAYITGTNALTLFDGTIWLTLYEPPQTSIVNAWLNGPAIWSNAPATTMFGAISGTYKRAGGMCWIDTTIVHNGGAGTWAPQFSLPGIASGGPIEGVFDVAILQAGRTYFDGWAVALGGTNVGIFAKQADTVGGGGNCLLRAAVNSVTPFNWTAAPNSSISVSGWYRMAALSALQRPAPDVDEIAVED